MSEKCEWVKADGTRCRSYALDGQQYCSPHGKQAEREQGLTLARSNVRGRLAADAAEAYDAILDAIEDGVRAEKTVWGTCTNCNHRVSVSAPDWAARARMVSLWLGQGLGRPTGEAPVTTGLNLAVLTSQELVEMQEWIFGQFPHVREREG